MELSQAIEQILDGKALLFLGSGFSFGAKPKGYKEFLTGRGLAKYLYDLAEIETEDRQLNIAAELFENKFGRDELHRKLLDLFSVDEVTTAQVEVAGLPWQTIFTTNYDDVLETAAAQSDKTVKPLRPSDDAKGRILSSRHCVHINGFLPGSAPEDLENSIKLSNSSYLTEAFDGSLWGFAFRKSLQAAKAIFFIGYSMYDLDIQRILFNSDVMNSKVFFIERKGLDKNTVQFGLQSNFGTVYDIGVDEFISRIFAVAADYIPVNDKDTLRGMSQLSIDTPTEFRDDRVFDLLLRGVVDLSLLQDSLRSDLPGSYFLRRWQHDHAIQDIEAGARVLLISGDMANGKTAFCTGLGVDLMARGYDVFQIDDQIADLIHDVDVISRRKQNKVLLIEGLSRNWGVVKQYYNSKHSEDILIVTIKSAFVESQLHEIREVFGEGVALTVDLDFLSDPDIDQLRDLMSEYKFWGTRDVWSDFGKSQHIKGYCNRQLSSVLLDIIRSPEVRGRFNNLISTVSEDNISGKILIVASVLLLADFHIDDFILTEVLPADSGFRGGRTVPVNVAELLSKTERGYQFRSSVVAKYIMNEYPSSQRLVDTLIEVTKAAHHRSGFDGMGRMFFELYRTLVTFSFLQSLLPEKGKRDALIRFYENVKNLESAKTHPHFWLQYALARISYDSDEDLEMGKLFLDTAYARAKRIEGYHTDHMDNAKARYLVKSATNSSNFDNSFVQIKEAQGILIRQARSEKNHIPFRVARLYSAYYSKHRRDFSEIASNQFNDFVSSLIAAIPSLILDRVGKREVEIARKELQSILDDMGTV